MIITAALCLFGASVNAVVDASAGTGGSARVNNTLDEQLGGQGPDNSSAADIAGESNTTFPKYNVISNDNLTFWGTLDAEYLPDFLGFRPEDLGPPWTNLTVNNTDATLETPVTNETRTYNLTLDRAIISSDGVPREVILFNNQFPGPLIEANWGDWIVVNVLNNLTNPEEGTAVHWHGFLQKETPWYDGVPAVHQCPIIPGAVFTYRFRADQYGTTWYHSHSAQYTGGAFGPLIVHGPRQIHYDIDVGPIMLNDWSHREYSQVIEGVVHDDALDYIPIVAPNPDNNMINGKNTFNCSLVPSNSTCVDNAELSKFQLVTGKVHRLRLINTGAHDTQKFSIDNHTMTVMAYDFVPIVPYDTQVITLGIGQRADVLISATNGKNDSSFWMRANTSAECTLNLNPHAKAKVFYSDADTDSTPTSVPTNEEDGVCANDDLSLTIPVYPIRPPTTVSHVQNFDFNFTLNETGNLVWTMNNRTFRGNYNSPLFLLAAVGNTSLAIPAENEFNLYNLPPATPPKTATTIRINIYNLTPFAHPFHFHGHNMFIQSVGPGRWNTSSGDGQYPLLSGASLGPGEAETYIDRASNPMRRDVQLVPAMNHLVFDLDSTFNPGVWPLHCHIAYHASAGLYSNIMYGADAIQGLPVPAVMAEQCETWSNWQETIRNTNTSVVEQIDSGI